MVCNYVAFITALKHYINNEHPELVQVINLIEECVIKLHWY